jgi:3-hydroxyacyl-CoA dehydrogenase/enoyl-CoA hydratase/3-hydroxybutyryl-CoA epimerase
MAKIFRLEESRVPGIYWITFDLPGEKVNKLSREVMGEFEALLPELEKQAKTIQGLILRSGKPGNFIAGADIEMIQGARSSAEAEALSRMGQKLLDRWEDLPFPTIAAVEGAALGGGCEFCLASTAILVSNDSAARLGLPEVMLGILPGMGGCVRLPRKIGLASALDLLLTGKTLSGERAARLGLAEACLPRENFEQSVLNWVTRNLESLKSHERLAKDPTLGGVGGPVGTLLEKTSLGRGVILKKATDGVLKKTFGHYPAPLEIIKVLEDTGASVGPKLRGAGRDQATAREARGFGQLAATEVSKNLIRLFFMTERVKKSNGLPSGTVLPIEPRMVHSAGVLGAGTMGGGIAQLLAEKRIPVRMKDLNHQALQLGVQAATRIFQKQVKRKRLSKREMLQKLNLISPVLGSEAFPTLDLVIEAIVENLGVKQKVFQELEGAVRADCVIVSNTSSLSITAMQSVLKNPERFAGMHFFNPVAKMPLIEVIRGEKTSDATIAAVYAVTKQLGKTPIVVRDRPGFLVNRLLGPYLNEASYLVKDGVPIDEVDSVCLAFGMPMGPMELIDEVGVDVGEKVGHILEEAFGARMPAAKISEELVKKGRLGKKSKVGIYRYDEAGKNKTLDTEIYELVGVTPKPKSVSQEEILERCLLPMINEAARCLEEKVIESAWEVDLGMIMGTGFPPFRGGLLRYADSLGAKSVVDRLKLYHSRFGARFEPAPRLLKMAERGERFHE